MQDRRIKEYRNKRKELLREIQLSEKKIIEIKSLISITQRNYENNKLSYEEYIKLISSKYDGRTLTQWKGYRDELRIKLEKIKEDREVKETPAYLPFVLIIVLGLGLVLAGTAMQGLLSITGSAVEKIYNFGVPIEVNESETMAIFNETSNVPKINNESFTGQAVAITCTPDPVSQPDDETCEATGLNTAKDYSIDWYDSSTCGTHSGYLITTSCGVSVSSCIDTQASSQFATGTKCTAIYQSGGGGGNKATDTFVVQGPTTTTTTSTSSTSSTLPHANLTLYLRNSTAQSTFTGLYTNITAFTNESINITSSEPYPADVNMTLYVMDYAGINQSRNISKSFLENFTTFWTTGSFLINISWEGNLTMFGNSTAFWVDVNPTTTTSSSTSSSSTSSSTLPRANLTLYLTNSSFTGLYQNITAFTNESVNITSKEPYPADVNMTLFITDYAGVNQSRNISKFFLENFTTFWTSGDFLINISWEGNLTIQPNSTAFYITVLATSTTSSTSSSSTTLPYANLTLYLRNSTAQASFTGLYTNISALINESINITSIVPYPADVNMTLFVTNYTGGKYNQNISKSFLQNFTNFWTNGSFLINVTWEGNSTFFGNSTAFYVDVGATTTTSSTTSTTVNVAPVIVGLSNIGIQTISEQTQTFVTFYYNVSDANGAQDVNGSSAKAQFNQSTNTYRANTSCNSLGAVNASTMQFECIVDVWYFDAGSLGYNVSVKDNSSNYVEDTDQAFSIAQTRGMAMSPTALTFPTVTLGSGNNSASNNPITINNSGNVNISTNKINLTSYNLHGLTTVAESISATNFTVNRTNNCAGASGGTKLANNTKFLLPENSMDTGNVSLGTTFNTTLYFCLWNVPATGISGQTYDTSASVAWEVRVF